MTFDYTTAGGEAALLEQLGFNPQDRFAFSSSSAPSAIPATSTDAMSQSSRPSPPVTWPLALDMTAPGSGPASIHSPNSVSLSISSPDDNQSGSPAHHSSAASSPHQQQLSPYQPAAIPSLPTTTSLLTDWTFAAAAQPQQPSQDLSQFMPDSSLIAFNHFTAAAAAGLQPSPLDYLPVTTQALENSLHPGLPQMPPAFNTMSPTEDASQTMQWGIGMSNWSEFEAAMQMQADGIPRMAGSLGSNSPTGTYLEVVSLGSGSDSGWVDVYSGYNSFQQSQQAQNAAIFNPGQTLHLRTNSDSTDGNSLEFGSYEEVPFPYSPFSPDSDTYVDASNAGSNSNNNNNNGGGSNNNNNNHRNCFPGEGGHQRSHAGEVISPAAAVGPMPIQTTPSSKTSPASGSGSSASPPSRRGLGVRKSPMSKPTKSVIRRSPSAKKDGTVEKKVGRRRGPLLPEQRKQASEIRKLRACLRCKFLKKTCDKGEPCTGCQPSHARLWQVPCTRIDIKDIGYFMKDWKADYERHLSRGVSVYNVKGFAQKETLMWITHGYGYALPVHVREVYVADDSCFQCEWVESWIPEQEPIEFETRTERLDVGQEGISTAALNEYLDKHIEGPFDKFIDDHFEGTPFITEILKTAHRYYVKERLPVIRKALKLVLAYNLTLHITMVEQQGDEEEFNGQIDDEDSKYYGKTVAPVMINFQIKCAMADMWRDLQKDILEELSALYSSVYSGDRLKNWPTIFMLASILLAVWEEMQFDCHYRVPDPAAVNKFCTDMETIPVGVIVGLFHAISQKLPAFTEWDTRQHGHVLNNNPAVCDAMTEVRQHVLKHETYLRTRQDCKFDRYDFDSLSNKFLSKLVIRAN